jgi:hypothetical protein
VVLNPQTLTDQDDLDSFKQDVATWRKECRKKKIKKLIRMSYLRIQASFIYVSTANAIVMMTLETEQEENLIFLS